jgi:hypothetical protein
MAVIEANSQMYISYFASESGLVAAAKTGDVDGGASPCLLRPGDSVADVEVLVTGEQVHDWLLSL